MMWGKLTIYWSVKATEEEEEAGHPLGEVCTQVKVQHDFTISTPSPLSTHFRLKRNMSL